MAITNINTTSGYTASDGTGTGSYESGHELSQGLKTYYDTELLENARGELVFEQFARRQPLPENRGTTVEWRKWDELPDAPQLTEGVIPNGQKLGQTVITDTIDQYGMFVPISDRLDLHHVDNVLLGATEELGASAGETMDKLVRNDLLTGTNVLYCDTVAADGTATPAASRMEMHNGANMLTPDMVNQAFTLLRKMKAPLINGKYVAIIHPSVAYDLRQSAGWVDAHKYADPEAIYNGEIGELHNVRFVVSVNSKVDAGGFVYTATAYTGTDENSTAAKGTATAYKLTVPITADELDDVVGKDVYINISGTCTANTIKCASANTLWLEKSAAGAGSGTKVVETGGAVYCSVFMGRDAYGTIDVAGGNLRMIVKSAEEAGGPLNQFATAGYKFETNGAKILYQNRLLRVESCGKYSANDSAN